MNSSIRGACYRPKASTDGPRSGPSGAPGELLLLLGGSGPELVRKSVGERLGLISEIRLEVGRWDLDAEAAPDLARQGLGEKLGAALPPGSAGIVAIYDRAKTDTVNTTLASAVLKSAAEIDGGGTKQLRAALEEAQDGMGGGTRRKAHAWPAQ